MKNKNVSTTLEPQVVFSDVGTFRLDGCEMRPRVLRKREAVSQHLELPAHLLTAIVGTLLIVACTATHHEPDRSRFTEFRSFSFRFSPIRERADWFCKSVLWIHCKFHFRMFHFHVG